MRYWSKKKKIFETHAKFHFHPFKHMIWQNLKKEKHVSVSFSFNSLYIIYVNKILSMIRCYDVEKIWIWLRNWFFIALPLHNVHNTKNFTLLILVILSSSSSWWKKRKATKVKLIDWIYEGKEKSEKFYEKRKYFCLFWFSFSSDSIIFRQKMIIEWKTLLKKKFGKSIWISDALILFFNLFAFSFSYFQLKMFASIDL